MKHAATTRSAGRSSLTAVLALALALLTLAGCASNPVTGQPQLAFFTVREEIEIGQQSDREVVAELGLYADLELEARVAEVGRRLAAGAERPELPWTFRIVDDPTVNAFALPGGYIYVTRGLLAHLGSEAQLAGVLGHEIGHVTARHGVHEMSRQLLTLGVLGLGALMLPEEDQELAGALLAAGTGLLFLKYSRDDERQADDLGLRYMAAGGWAPPAMPEVFTVLERVGEQDGGALPSWLSTHPSPERRRERMNASLAGMSWDPGTARVAAGDYLDLLDGLAFGADPRRGFLRQGTFFHPGWKLELHVPAGWQAETTAAGVSLVNADEDALLLLEAAEEATTAAAAAAFFGEEGVEGGDDRTSSFGGLRAYERGFTASDGELELAGLAAFVENAGGVLRVLAVSAAEDWNGRQAELTRALRSLRPTTDRYALAATPARLAIVELPRAMRLEEFAAAYPSSVPLETIALINGVEPGAVLPAGGRVKRVVGD